MDTEPDDRTGGLVLRPGSVEDLPSVADVYLRSRAAAEPSIPPVVRPPAEVRSWVLGWDLDVTDLWVACRGDRVLGFALATPTWLDHLYVDPDSTGQGVGAALLAVVQATRPAGFGLWVFESNEPARRFYERHGLVEVRRTDGSENEERAPDIHLSWAGTG